MSTTIDTDSIPQEVLSLAQQWLESGLVQTTRLPNAKLSAFQACIPELGWEDCCAVGSTQQVARENLLPKLTNRLYQAHKQGETLPQPPRRSL